MQEYANPGSRLARDWVSPQVLQELERQRRIARSRFVKTVLTVAVVSIGLGLGVVLLVNGEIGGDGLVGVGVAGTFLTVFSVALSQMYFMSYRRNFKGQVVAGLVQKVDSGLKLHGESGMTKEEYDASCLFRNEAAATSFLSEDLIEGTSQGVALRFSEAVASRTYRSGNKSRTETIFRGVIGRVAMPAAVAAPLVLIPRERARDEALGGTPKLEPVRLGDAEFDLAYAAYSTNSEAVRSLVTPDLRHALLAATKSKRRPNLRVSLVDDALYFSFSQAANLLEPPWFTSLANVDLSLPVAEVKSILQLAAELRRRLTPGRASA